MTVLLQGPGQHGEMHPPVFFIDRHHTHDHLSLAVPGNQHHAGTDAAGSRASPGVDQQSP
jgi:hypothetical protein